VHRQSLRSREGLRFDESAPAGYNELRLSLTTVPDPQSPNVTMFGSLSRPGEPRFRARLRSLPDADSRNLFPCCARCERRPPGSRDVWRISPPQKRRIR